MSIAPWRDQYCTGHQEIDTQHQALFELVNRIHAAAIAGNGPSAAIRAMLVEFVARAREHFALEEELMRAWNYPNYPMHCATHRNLCNKVQSTLEKFDRDPATFSQELPQVLADWMVHHIQGEDRQTIAFFRAQGCPEVASAQVRSR